MAFYGVLVIGFDGNGNVTAGRLTRLNGFGVLQEHAISVGWYEVYADGMGYAFVDAAPHTFDFMFAVGDGGRIVKFAVRGNYDALRVVGDLVKQ
jgi:hypothetical protein